jgi:hypothetical protein
MPQAGLPVPFVAFPAVQPAAAFPQVHLLVHPQMHPVCFPGPVPGLFQMSFIKFLLSRINQNSMFFNRE